MPHSSRTLSTAATLAVAVLVAAPAAAQAPPAAGQTAADQAAALAKQLSNPVASLVSVPFQANWEFGVGPEEDTRFLINFQPVMPFSLNDKWNLIARVIVPILSQPALVPGGTPTFGVSDILFSAFFSPKEAGIVWGVGPVLLLPTTADPFLGTGKWGAGPTFVVLKQTGGWTYGALANHIWSVAGEESRSDVNQTFLQPFMAYTTKSAVTVTLQTESVANWEAASGEEWTVPINVVLSKVVKIGRKPLSVAFGGGYYVESPAGGPEWKLRSALTLLFPAR